MTKSTTKTKTSTKGKRGTTVMPLPPVIYINDGASPDAPEPALALLKLLPKFSYSAVTASFGQDAALPLLATTKAEGWVAVFISTHSHASSLIGTHSSAIEQACIKHGRKFLSVNLHESGSAPRKTRGPQHLSYAIQEGTTVTAVARDVLKWLCKSEFRLRSNES